MREYTESPVGADGRSGIVEHMMDRAGLNGEEAMYARLYPVGLDVSHVEGTADAFRISDRNGQVPTSEEFWTFVDHVARFYTVTDDEEIEARNRRLRRLSDFSANSAAKTPAPPTPQDGYVYLLRSGDCYKIGRAKDPRKRSETLAIQLPHAVQMVHHFWAENYKVAERDLHLRFSDRRLNGEWFDLSDEDVRYIKGLGE